MLLPIAVISASWLLNAVMDAIDHGNPLPLRTLWHTLKWLSYAIPYGYIMLLTRMHPGVIFLLAAVLWALWEALYHYLRHINIAQYDH